jgi:hypothetical protein
LSARAQALEAAADRQIAELIELVSSADAATLGDPCQGREKLGDGTVGALAAHTADNYLRIAMFVAPGHDVQTEHGDHGHPHAADSASTAAVAERLADARRRLAAIAELADEQLDAIPAKDSFRFCDGQRTLEQVLAGLLKHQEHQVGALRAALA